MNSENEFDEKFFHAISGIKKAKKQKKVSLFKWGNGILTETESDRVFVPGQGIVDSTRETEIIFDCGHSSRFSIGHISDCGHAVCRICLFEYILTCANPGCFKKLCTVQGCDNSARAMSGLFFCKKHKLFAFFKYIFSRLFLGKLRTQQKIDAVKLCYYLPFHREVGGTLTDET